MTARGRPPPEASVLLVDIGNTRVKWAVLRHGRLSRMQAGAHAGWSSGDFVEHMFRGRAATPGRILVASVAAPAVVRRFTAAARRSCGPGGAVPEFISTSRRAAGVVTRYRDPWRLGVDRFMGVIAAHRLAGGRGACVINAGTAVTLDLVDGHGVHVGGAILPSSRLMIESLLRRTAGIAQRARGARGAGPARRGAARGPFARDTAAAIEHGAREALVGAVERVIAESHRLLGAAPLVIVTGGGGGELRRLIHYPTVEIADLVLQGIALHAGLALR